MLVGILSDNHGRLPILRAAVGLLRGRGAGHLIHCGDLCGEGTIDELAGGPGGGSASPTASFVWGNCDDPADFRRLADHAASVGVACLGIAGELTLGGKRFAVTHGDRPGEVRRRLASGDYDYLLLGHTHAPFDGRDGRTRVVNPGALHRATAKTVALLDTDADRLEWLAVADAEWE